MVRWNKILPTAYFIQLKVDSQASLISSYSRQLIIYINAALMAAPCLRSLQIVKAVKDSAV